MMFPYYQYSYIPMYKNMYPYRLACIFPQGLYRSTEDVYDTHHRSMFSSAFPDHPSSTKNNHSSNKDYYVSLNSLDNLHPFDEMNSHGEAYNIAASFHELMKTDQEKAISLINGENLPFSSLFLLKHDIEKYEIFDQLNLRNRVALSIADEIIIGRKDTSAIQCSSCDYIQTVHSVLKWMLETGSIADGLSNEYDEILDITATLLIKVYRDKTILPMTIDMIFKRYAKGLFINHLVWTFFQSHDPNSLISIAARLKSENAKDVDLARKLLSFCPLIDIRDNAPGEKQYAAFVDWMKENCLFLHFTGETFQQSTYPIPYVIVLEAKYLYKSIDLLTGKTFEAFSEKESQLLDVYTKLDMDTKILLANFSYLLHQKNISSWKTWIQYPIAHQIAIAGAAMGVKQ
ncbi:hypothetical protein HNQ80_003420 [Anaerosolibacter carboniphilus]|uniref:Uncharacterized protein n=1 Tax=Anaerosolibacter carboniphilus TaxID=1417629 RepID=A0A841KV17_9FIRM|nr:hypothetical protein [Anaerosolibacter carboniphilus]MBB6217301.1 hypothetical protein [Anaerosolibacter carboniphilus]